jgi:methyl-accepting chemotaxis protein
METFTTQQSNKRKVFLINPRFQLSFMAWMVGISFVVIATFYAANWWFFRKFWEQGQALGLPPDHVFFEFLRDQRHEMDWIFVGTAAVAFVAVCLIGLVLSHRVAGPLYRLHKHMKDVADGKTTEEVRFRTKDHFLELSDAFNAQLARMKKFAVKKKVPAKVVKRHVA